MKRRVIVPRKYFATVALVVGSLVTWSTVATTQDVPAGGNTRTGSSGPVRLSLEDRFAIQELFARYSQDLDMGTDTVTGKDDLITNVFAPNGIFHDPSLCLIGSTELRKLVDHKSRAKTQQHWPHNIVITEGDGSHAKTHSYVIVFSARGGSPATYRDTLVKIGGRWLFQDREVWRQGAVTRDPRCPTDLEALEP
jgi:hypothetical protein